MHSRAAHVRGVAVYRSLPTLDASLSDPAEFRALIEELAASSQTLFIHCAQGHGRTGTFTAALLLLRGLAPAPPKPSPCCSACAPASASNRPGSAPSRPSSPPGPDNPEPPDCTSHRTCPSGQPVPPSSSRVRVISRLPRIACPFRHALESSLAARSSAPSCADWRCGSPRRARAWPPPSAPR
ncbi:tyrosine-protein phosphatase [Nannocystis exedens]|uniref:phosphatase domain-containing protein n=1 Tax=Nannocystis exedens TaxID=54 RepID=UPI000BBA0509